MNNFGNFMNRQSAINIITLSMVKMNTKHNNTKAIIINNHIEANSGKLTNKLCQKFLETYKALKSGLQKELQQQYALIIQLQKRKLEFIQGYKLSKIRNLCNTFEISIIGTNADMLRTLSKAILEKEPIFYDDIVNELLKEHEINEETNVML